LHDPVVVDRQHQIHEGKKTVGKTQVVRWGVRQSLDLAHHIISEVTYGAAPQSRESFDGQGSAGS
jgi:hypothetical protein